MDVFISWTGADRDVKNALAKRLQDAGISYWDSDQRCTSDYAAECTAAIKQCGVFVAIISDASMAKGSFVQNEVTTARTLEGQGKLNILVYKITESPYTDAFEFLLNHVSFVTGNIVQRHSGSVGENGIDAIVKRAQTLLQSRRDGTPEKPFDVRIPEIDGLQLAKNSYFVEGSRDTVIEALEKGFCSSNTVILSEFVGYGKRSVIRAFAQRHKDTYTTAVAVDNSGSSLRDFFLTGLHFTNLNERLFNELEGDALLQAKFRFLNRLDENTLLVIPNVQLEAQPDPLLCQLMSGLKCHLAILTQSDAEAYEDLFPVIRVGRLQDEHLYQLFFHHYCYTSEEEQAQLKEPLARFFDSIGGHTKTVELTASALNREIRIPPEELPEYLSMQGAEGLQLKERIIRQIENIFNIELLNAEAVTALLVAAYIAVPHISEKHFYQVLQQCGVQDRQIVAQLDEHRWLDLDKRNRTVSIEPLVAQVVLSRVSEPFAVANICFDYLVDLSGASNGLSASGIAARRNLRMIGHFLHSAGFEVGAQLVEQFILYSSGDHCKDVDALKRALSRFEECYPALVPDESEENDENDEELFQSDLQKLEESVRSFLYTLIPFLKLAANGLDKLFLDYSAVSNQILAGESAALPSAIEGALGISQEELRQLLDVLHNEVESADQVDDGDFELLITMQCLAVMDGLLSRNFADIAVGANRLLDYICATPEVLSDEEYSQFIYPTLQVLGRWFLSTRAFSFAVLFCEKLLELPMNEPQRMSVLAVYTGALSAMDVYSEQLFDAYEELLAGYDRSAQKVFASRELAAAEKKQLLLRYAYDLALSGRAEEAIVPFAAAQQMTEQFLPDQEVRCAYQIVETFTRNGEFDGAVKFIQRHFREKQVEKYQAAGSEETGNILADFALYQAAGQQETDDFSDNADPQKYISYYQAFSRKNNKLQEQKYLSVADAALEYDFSHLSDEELAAHTELLRQQARRKTPLQLAPEAFALAGEAGCRVLGYRHHYVQFMGAAAMADGKIAEILNGEGKTYTIVLTAFLQYLFGKQVFVVDESSHLTERNYTWMQGIYRLLGVPVFLASDYQQISVERDLAADASVIYTDLKTLAIGYLHYELKYCECKNKLRLDCVIIDEADTTLVDMAVQDFGLVNQSTSRGDLHIYRKAWELAQDLPADERYYTYEHGRIILQPDVYPLVEQSFRVSYSDMSKMETLQQIEQVLRAALLCCRHYEKEKDYFIRNGIPVHEDKDKGVFQPFAAVYDYFLCKENGLDTARAEKAIISKSTCLNCICVRELFRKFKTVCGTTATAVSFQKEFKEIYNLEYVCIPPHSPCIRQENLSGVYISKRLKVQAILELVQEKTEKKQPILLITQSVAESEQFSRYLKQLGIEHRLLNARNAYAFSDVLALAGTSGSVLVTNALAGRGADIKLGGDPELMTRQELVEQGEDISQLNSFVYCVATPEQKELPLYRKYYSILEKNKRLCAADRQAVIEAGGLCVIGTAFFPEPRTEQQTIGRCARQGTVGESWLFRSLEDESLRAFIPPATMKMFESLAGDMEIPAGENSMMTRAIRKAQQQLHASRFAKIRQYNDSAQCIEKARAEFVGRSHELVDRKISADVLLKEWAHDKAVLRELQALQRGESSENWSLFFLWEANPELRKAKGFRAADGLYNVLREWIAKRLKDVPVEELLFKLYLRAWNEYIDTVQLLGKGVDPQNPAVQKHLAEKKKTLLRKPIERLIVMIRG